MSMYFFKNERAFTLIEVLLTISIFSIALISISNVNISLWNFFNYNNDKIETEQEARVISSHLEYDLKRVSNIKKDGNDLLLNIKNLDGDYDYYIKYYVSSQVLKKKYLKDNPSDFSVIYDGENPDSDWPSDIQWNNTLYFNTHSISSNVITDYGFTVGSDLVSYNFDIEINNQTYNLSNQIHPRLID